ncbi:hypothetical protein [Methylobacterium sp. ID0610]|uniref:hypothetical protein n=1 Tax=Methylobacterium carpenticola TaxID=3344827 RepID=UPI0036808C4A
MTTTTDLPRTDEPSTDLATPNGRLPAGAAASAEEGPSPVDRLQAMGCELRGKSREARAGALRHPPTRAART